MPRTTTLALALVENTLQDVSKTCESSDLVRASYNPMVYGTRLSLVFYVVGYSPIAEDL